MEPLSAPAFAGTPKRIRLVSNNFGYGPLPASDEEIEQRLTVTSEGRVWFSGYGPSIEGKGDKLRSAQYRIDPSIGSYIVERVAERFSVEYVEEIVMDAGAWELEIQNTAGEVYRFSGPLIEAEDEAFGNLSDLIRYHLGLDLFAFDGNSAEDQIDHIEIEYYRNTKIKPEVPFSDTVEYAVWDYRETIVIDRKSETITYKRVIGSGCDVTTTYHVEQGVREFLNELDGVDLFSEFPEEPKDAVENPLEKRTYTITVDYMKSPQMKVMGDFDRDGLPNDWASFAEELLEFISFYMGSEMLDPAVYDKPKRRSDSLIFCSVEFEADGKRYYYLADEDEYEDGDRVIVPVKDAGDTAVVKIVRVQYFSKDMAPFPLTKMKHIIRRAPVDEQGRAFCPVLNRHVDDADCMEICAVADGELSKDVIQTFDNAPAWSEETKNTCLKCCFHSE